MSDVHDTETRSRNMRAIQSKNTKPELLIRQWLHREGFRYRLHRRDLPGNPDIVLPKHGAVIFVHGCFWHGHDCHLFKVPQARRDFWLEKIGSNQNRDRVAIGGLLRQGWRVLTIWECALKGRLRRNQKDVTLEMSSWLLEQDGSAVLDSSGVRPLISLPAAQKGSSFGSTNSAD